MQLMPVSKPYRTITEDPITKEVRNTTVIEEASTLNLNVNSTSVFFARGEQVHLDLMVERKVVSSSGPVAGAKKTREAY